MTSGRRCTRLRPCPSLAGVALEREAQAAIAAAVNDLELMGCSSTERYGVGAPGFDPRGLTPSGTVLIACPLVSRRLRRCPPELKFLLLGVRPCPPRAAWCRESVPRTVPRGCLKAGWPGGVRTQTHRPPDKPTACPYPPRPIVRGTETDDRARSADIELSPTLDASQSSRGPASRKTSATRSTTTEVLTQGM